MTIGTVAVIGLGQVGAASFREITAGAGSKWRVLGYDTSPEVRAAMATEHGTAICHGMPPADVYLINTYEHDHTRIAYRACRATNPNALIILECAVHPLQAWEYAVDAHCAATCPHRWNPGDPEHGALNQTRVIGAEQIVIAETVSAFYSMAGANTADWPHTTFAKAAWSKTVENAHRYFEIALAEEMAMRMIEGGAEMRDVQEIIRLCNTKWNIDIKEPRTGIGGKCLPKDVSVFLSALPGHTSGRVLRMVDAAYTSERAARRAGD